MLVDKFGRMSDTKTRDTGVSLTYINNNNYVRSDGNTSVISSIDMGGNTLTNVSNPVNPQDVVTKEYADTANRDFVFDKDKYLAAGEVSMGGKRLENVGTPLENNQATNKAYVDKLVEAATAGDEAFKKQQDGTFKATGNIDMGGENSIVGLPNPIDNFAAANKNYVDNGGAITKLPNGKFTAVSDIDFNGCSLKNISDPSDKKDAVNKAYVDGKTIQPAAPIKPIITVWAEEKGPLGNGHYEFLFGNGSSGSEHAYGGYCMSVPGRIIRGSLTVTESRTILAEEVKVNIVVNGIEQVSQSFVKKSGDIYSCTIFRDLIELKQCHIINFISRTANSRITNAYVSILIELDLKSKSLNINIIDIYLPLEIDIYHL